MKFLTLPILLLTVGSAFAQTRMVYATFSAPYDNGYILLTDHEGMEGCPSGSKSAAERKVILDEVKVIRWLCYTVNEKKGVVEFKDPNKFVFGSFSIRADKFTRTMRP